MTGAGKKKGLGKGLEALIPHWQDVEQEAAGNDQDQVRMIPIEQVYPNENQPRKVFQPEALSELAASLRQHGMIQPILVAKKQKGYMIIVGERRWRAAQQVEMEKIPCIVKEYTDRQLYEVALIENLQRENLSVIEEATAYQYLMEEYRLNHEELGDALGKSRSYVANTIRLLQLSPEVMMLVKEGRLSGSQGRALLGIEDDALQLKLALRIIDSKLNVRQVEEMVRQERTRQKKKVSVKKRDPELVAVETRLQDYFNTKVKITNGAKKGKIEIEYYNQQDLQRILDMLNS
ncbi:ParB/RepB/Spo0J family partition protein [Anoxynatronum buryatiense]|uniref:Chromosome partitioning protein, ParB family n=1 Tax=Anoxynatronum buryatiense TaxID=489973 RepID=A0AA45WWL2_9CLOT|nr:ParB/RepB/Spo0J family partition protein [Anoxynatronum buryatiense]SMP58418.1 chromosome partitioning protein, ParB family [Anoxynatronum buryatiense]